MTQQQAGGALAAGRESRWLSVMASLAAGAAFLALWFWLLPGWLGFKVEAEETARWRWLAAVPAVLGFTVALRCVWDFGWTGRGTPVPVAPPLRLVMVGFYRYVLRSGVDRAVDCVRARQPRGDCRRSSGCPGGTSVRGLL